MLAVDNLNEIKYMYL